MLRAVSSAAFALLCLPVMAQESGDFDCVTSVSGPDTPGGILRVERDGDRGRFAFVEAAGEPHWSNVDFFDAQTILFDDTLAAHFAPGAIMSDAHWDAAAFAYAGNIVTAKGEQVPFTCSFTP